MEQEMKATQKCVNQQWIWISAGGTRCVWEPDGKGHGALSMFRGTTGSIVPNCNTLDEASEYVNEYTGEIPEFWTVEDLE